MSAAKIDLDWKRVAASNPPEWQRFVRQMQQVAPASPTALEFARQAFVAGMSAGKPPS